MSTAVRVPVVEITRVRTHPNADRLEIADVLGYQMVIPKDKHKKGDKVVYFPADVLIPAELANSLGVRNLLRGRDKDRVGKIRLRGEPSFGLITSLPDGGFDVGDNLADHFGVKKYEPPIRPSMGDQAEYDPNIDPHVQKYTDIENGRLFVDVFKEGEEVVVTEKIHGTNCIVGIVNGEKIASSHNVRRKPPLTPEGEIDFDACAKSIYWYPWTMPFVRSYLEKKDKTHNVLMYGEVYGGSIQSLNYGIGKGKGFGFRVFDVMVDGDYLSQDELITETVGIELVPLIYRGEYHMDEILELAEGDTMLPGSHMREGIVVKPAVERRDPKIGRVILKYISTEYALSKNSDFQDV